jgi:hypothetical protein
MDGDTAQEATAFEGETVGEPKYDRRKRDPRNPVYSGNAEGVGPLEGTDKVEQRGKGERERGPDGGLCGEQCKRTPDAAGRKNRH